MMATYRAASESESDDAFQQGLGNNDSADTGFAIGAARLDPRVSAVAVFDGREVSRPAGVSVHPSCELALNFLR